MAMKSISCKGIKEMSKIEGKRIGTKALKKVADEVEDYTKVLLKKAARNAAFSGRETIKEDDIQG